MFKTQLILRTEDCVKCVLNFYVLLRFSSVSSVKTNNPDSLGGSFKKCVCVKFGSLKKFEPSHGQLCSTSDGMKNNNKKKRQHFTLSNSLYIRTNLPLEGFARWSSFMIIASPKTLLKKKKQEILGFSGHYGFWFSSFTNHRNDILFFCTTRFAIAHTSELSIRFCWQIK